MPLTHHQAKYFAHALSLQDPEGIGRLSQSLFDAQVDLNPHQIEAALFALQSPLSKGVILADEVGLGKTIEAGLILCQLWAEKKRRILIIWRRLEANPDVEERHKIDWPVTDNKDLKAFADTNRGTARGLNPADTEFHAIYINGDHTLADPNSKIHGIEEVFYERMFANTGNPED
ncbi:MAG: hypothetical protein ACI9VS_002530 [Candidatus Binatia bacterium]|jgi:hypothetical protein